MINQLYSFAAGLLGLGVYIVIFLVFMRLRPSTGWFGMQIILGALVHLVATVFCFYFWQGILYWYSLGIFAVGWFLFFTVSAAVYVSISARILRTVDRSPDRAMLIDEIFTVCVQKPFEERVSFLVSSGLVQKVGDKSFLITSDGKINVQRIQLVRRFLRMEGSGLYMEVEDAKKSMPD